MKFGLMLRSQFLPDDDPVASFQAICSMARFADQLGFRNIVKGAHYAGAELLDFQQIPLLARLSAEAPNCRITPGIVLLSLHKPLDIAEQMATLDIITGGKLNFGVGIGYREVEFQAFGTTQRERVPRLEENLEVIKRLWTAPPVTYKGSHFELHEVSPAQRPVQKPYPPIWMGANADAAIRRAARIADCWYLPPHNRVDTLLEQMQVYRDELERLGKPMPADVPLRREVFVAASREEAMRLCASAVERKYRSYHSWGQDKAMPDQDNDLGQEIRDLMADRFFIGSPDEVAQSIIDICRPVGVTELVISVHQPGMELQVALDSMQLFAEEVIPRVRQGM